MNFLIREEKALTNRRVAHSSPSVYLDDSQVRECVAEETIETFMSGSQAHSWRTEPLEPVQCCFCGEVFPSHPENVGWKSVSSEAELSKVVVFLGVLLSVAYTTLCS